MSGIFRESFDDTNNAQEVEVLGATIGYDAGTKSVTSSADVLAAAGASNLSARKYVIIYNTGNQTVYVGPSGKANITTGLPIFKFSSITMNLGPTVSAYLRTDSGTSTVIIQEVG